jgi:hypothetical protein
LDTDVGKVCKNAVARGVKDEHNALIRNDPTSDGTVVASNRTGSLAGDGESRGEMDLSGASSLVAFGRRNNKGSWLS